MKVIVDKFPKEPKDCLFSECNRDYGNFVCRLWQGRGCEPSKCSFLKPITDFHAVEHMGKNMARMIPIE